MIFTAEAHAVGRCLGWIGKNKASELGWSSAHSPLDYFDMLKLYLIQSHNSCWTFFSPRRA